MKFLPRLKRYPVGSRVKRKNGPVVVKMADGGWVSEQRLIWVNSRNEELQEGDRVFFADGNPENTDPRNLVKVRFGHIRYQFRDASGPLYIPKIENRVRIKV
jgi:hypothetical protein